jgi:hypothetical protein
LKPWKWRAEMGSSQPATLIHQTVAVGLNECALDVRLTTAWSLFPRYPLLAETA